MLQTKRIGKRSEGISIINNVVNKDQNKKKKVKS